MTESIVSRWKVSQQTPQNAKGALKGPSQFETQRLKKESKKARKSMRQEILSEMSHSISSGGKVESENLPVAVLCYQEAVRMAEGHKEGSFPWASAWLGFDSQLSTTVLESGPISLATARSFFRERAKVWHPDAFQTDVETANEAMNNLNSALESIQKILNEK
jgi:hypothetical protein